MSLPKPIRPIAKSVGLVCLICQMLRDEAHREHGVSEEGERVLAVGIVRLESVPQELDVFLLLRGLEGERQVVAKLCGFFHGYRSETEAKQPAVFLGISQDCWEHMVPKVKTGDDFLERIIFVHGDDVLKAQFRGGFCADL